jgi:hypothetical protein
MDNWKTNDINNRITKVRNIVDLENKINLLLNNLDFKLETLESQKQFLKEILGESNNSALLNIENILKNITESKQIHEKDQNTNIYLLVNQKNTESNNSVNIQALYYFVLASLNVSYIDLFKSKLFRIKNQNNYVLFKNYIKGSNSGESKENIKSFFYFSLLILFNLDLLLKIKYLKNREVQKFIFRQLLLRK